MFTSDADGDTRSRITFAIYTRAISFAGAVEERKICVCNPRSGMNFLRVLQECTKLVLGHWRRARNFHHSLLLYGARHQRGAASPNNPKLESRRIFAAGDSPGHKITLRKDGLFEG
jgi:hypothetical protein